MGVQRTWCPRLRSKDSTDHLRAQQVGEHFSARVCTLLETHGTRCRQILTSDADGIRNMFFVRAVVGEVCKGVQDALTPAVRHGNQLYDSTVDDVQNPSIYVTYNDSQVYPDILIKFLQ